MNHVLLEGMERIKSPMGERINVRLDKKLLREIEAKAKRLNIDRTEALRRAAQIWARQIDLEEAR